MYTLAQQTRRYFLGQTGLGIGAVACHMLMGPPVASGDQAPPLQPALAAKPPMIPAKAKSIIYLHMAGSPSQLELFDHKPALQKYHDKPCPQEYLEGKRFAFIKSGSVR